ncbi:MAG: hypothetical protein HY078_02725 [Elusimicrobia bacterium]|nr:hypothetical protein [Elusimicrobiota bacterium]
MTRLSRLAAAFAYPWLAQCPAICSASQFRPSAAPAASHCHREEAPAGERETPCRPASLQAHAHLFNASVSATSSRVDSAAAAVPAVSGTPTLVSVERLVPRAPSPRRARGPSRIFSPRAPPFS